MAAPSVAPARTPVAPISLVVFDLDGTLVDSLRDLTESLNELLEEYGLRPHGQDAVGRMVGEGAATLVARGFAAAGREAPAGALARFLELYEGRVLRFTRPYPGALEMLDLLGRTHRLALLTNKPRLSTMAVLDGLGLAAYFGDSIVGGDEPIPRKPDPAGLLHLAGRAGVPAASTLLVGDSFVDFRTARSGGAQICMARYGFGFAEFPVEQLNPSDRLIDAPLQLLASL
ncbi:MAG: HAD family hydrolase [Vicinamibacterales bacterium]